MAEVVGVLLIARWVQVTPARIRRALSDQRKRYEEAAKRTAELAKGPDPASQTKPAHMHIHAHDIASAEEFGLPTVSHEGPVTFERIEEMLRVYAERLASQVESARREATSPRVGVALVILGALALGAANLVSIT